MGWNPINNEETVTKQKEIKIEYEIPFGKDYDLFVEEILKDNEII